ncbi:glycosyltransferase family 2 protein [Gracilibacillus oryzae]|uniref:Glycosyltransferase family 2 protein n=1 Tax=Gracilibacillus oryzae TaxID=1672701 RepID=A0A7C8GTL5_9BACI|nr:glycosyltransferase family 2 protein [Gracilibacillus oryzae]KAB8137559.1 glycosyltransferase family 2 protein [Gracilibacillus oryzae]
MYQTKVSIIIPTYNRPIALAELLASLCQQTFQGFEVIIVNDAGEDISHIVELYPELRCKLIDLEKNSHHVRARNTAVSYVKSEWIMLIDDDDLILPTHLETMLHEAKEYDFVYSDVEIVNYRMEECARVPVSHRLFAYEFDLEAMRKFSTYVPSGSMYRASIHHEIGLFDEKMRNYWDWDFFLRVAKNFRIRRVPVAGVLYDFSETGNNQSRNTDRMRPYLDKLSEKHSLGYLPTKNFFLLLEEPDVKERESESERIWDGQMPHSRINTESKGEEKCDNEISQKETSG